MKRAIYPGTFDPITFGHMDIVKRSLAIFDEVIVAVARRREKQTFFPHQERVRLTARVLANMKGVKVVGFDSLLVAFARKMKACAVIRGLRAVSDFDYELQMSLTNRKMHPPIETIFLTPSEQFIFVSSSLVKEIAQLGGKVDLFVPAVVSQSLIKKFKS